MTRSVSPASVAVRAIIHQIGILLKNRSAAGLKNVVAKTGTSNHNSRGSALQLGRTASPLVPLIDLYREAGRRAGHSPEQLTVASFRRIARRHHGRSRRNILSRLCAHFYRNREGTRLATRHTRS